MINSNIRQTLLYLIITILISSEFLFSDDKSHNTAFISWLKRYDNKMAMQISERYLDEYLTADSVKATLYRSIIKYYQEEKDFPKMFKYYQKYLSDCNNDVLFYDILFDFTQSAYELKSINQVQGIIQNQPFDCKIPDYYYNLFEASLLFSDGEFKNVNTRLGEININSSDQFYQQYQNLLHFNQIGIITNENMKHPLWAMTLSAIVPGLGKAYAGRYNDAVVAFSITVSSLLHTLYVIERDRSMTLPVTIWSAVSLWTYSSNIYGAKLAVDQYNKALKIDVIRQFRWNDK